MTDSGPPSPPAWVEIDLGALHHNLSVVRRRTGALPVLATVKADAYGHGAVAVARALEEAGVDWLGVAHAEEGAVLRGAGIGIPILVMSPVGAHQHDLFPELELTPLVGSSEQLHHWLEWARGRERTLGIHLKVDSGMGRLGLDPDELGAAVELLRRQRYLCLEGIASHLATSDEPDHPRIGEQEERFHEALAALDEEERKTVVAHIANSAAALHRPSSHHDLVRCGLSLYGIDPARKEPSLRAVKSVYCLVESVRHLPKSALRGGAKGWRAPRSSRIGLLPIGYGAGFPRQASRQARIPCEGRRVPLVGTMTMTSTLVDLTGVDARAGSRLTLLGGIDTESISAWDWAEWAGTIPYEIVARLGLGLPHRSIRSATASSNHRHDR